MDAIVNDFMEIIHRTGWRELSSYVSRRLRRLSRVSECPVIYIGSTNNLRVRFRDLAGVRHTVFFPITALLLGGWRLDYGFVVTQSSRAAMSLEDGLKNGYKRIRGALPALVSVILFGHRPVVTCGFCGAGGGIRTRE